MATPLLHDLVCVIHAHSRHSDGTGTIAQMAAAARRAGVDALLVTDHDTLAGRAEEGWYGTVLVLVGEEVSPPGRDHTLAFGVDRAIRHRGRSAADICADVAAQGGISFAAHPFSHGSPAFPRFGDGTPFTDLEAPQLTGLELWSFVTDSAESMSGVAAALRFIARPANMLTHAPRRNLDGWDRVLAKRRLVAIGGVDAHQFGLKLAGRTPLRLMGYARSFSHLRTHALCEELPSGELERDRAQVYDALAAGRCYIAVDSLAPARGFAFWAEPSADAPSAGETRAVVPMGGEASAGHWTLRVRLPRPADVSLVANGRAIAAARGAELDVQVDEPAAYRVEARLNGRTWILSNPIYLRER